MIRRSWVLGALLAACAGPAWPAAPASPPAVRAPASAKAVKKAQLSFPSGRMITVDVVDTPAARERGLMFRKRLPKDYGMLFVFPGDLSLQFWMKNTWVSLDIVYIGPDKRITRVHERVKPSTPRTSDADVARVGGKGQYVLELPAGTAGREGLKAGQAFRFEAAIPES
jgi:uncharacterized membrane protein (UPF0127 family)